MTNQTNKLDSPDQLDLSLMHILKWEVANGQGSKQWRRTTEDSAWPKVARNQTKRLGDIELKWRTNKREQTNNMNTRHSRKVRITRDQSGICMDMLWHIVVPVLPHTPVAEVSKIGTYRMLCCWAAWAEEQAAEGPTAGCTTAGPTDSTHQMLRCMQRSPHVDLLAADSVANRVICPAISLSILFTCLIYPCLCPSLHLTVHLSCLSIYIANIAIYLPIYLSIYSGTRDSQCTEPINSALEGESSSTDGIVRRGIARL